MSNDHGGVGVFDKQGNLVISSYFADAWMVSKVELWFDIVRDFQEGFADVGFGYWWAGGFVDIEGNVVVPIEFDEVRNFSEGLVWVRRGSFGGL